MNGKPFRMYVVGIERMTSWLRSVDGLRLCSRSPNAFECIRTLSNLIVGAVKFENRVEIIHSKCFSLFVIIPTQTINHARQWWARTQQQRRCSNQPRTNRQLYFHLFMLIRCLCCFAAREDSLSRWFIFNAVFWWSVSNADVRIFHFGSARMMGTNTTAEPIRSYTLNE